MGHHYPSFLGWLGWREMVFVPYCDAHLPCMNGYSEHCHFQNQNLDTLEKHYKSKNDKISCLNPLQSFVCMFMCLLWSSTWWLQVHEDHWGTEHNLEAWAEPQTDWRDCVEVELGRILLCSGHWEPHSCMSSSHSVLLSRSLPVEATLRNKTLRPSSVTLSVSLSTLKVGMQTHRNDKQHVARTAHIQCKPFISFTNIY